MNSKNPEIQNSRGGPAGGPTADPGPARRLVVWKTAGQRPYYASLRYRCLLQLPYLRALGWESLVLFRNETVRDWSKVAALILVKSCRDNDVALAREAAGAGVAVIYDLTDNFFAERDSGPKIERQRRNIQELSQICLAFTVASPAMIDLIRPHLRPDIPIHVVPDPIETETDTRAAYDIEDWRRDIQGLRVSPPWQTFKRIAHGWWEILCGNFRGVWHRVPPVPPPRRVPDRKRIVWFGQAGRQSEAGLSALADILPELEKVNRETAIELLVVSNSRKRFREEIVPAGFPTSYRAWHPFGIFACIQSADAVVVPNRANSFSLAKSSNRSTLALSLGVPVAATMSASLAPLEAALYGDEWAASLAAIFSRPEEARRRVALGRAAIESEFSGPSVASRREDILRSVLGELSGAAAHRDDVQSFGTGAGAGIGRRAAPQA